MTLIFLYTFFWLPLLYIILREYFVGGHKRIFGFSLMTTQEAESAIKNLKDETRKKKTKNRTK